MQAAISNTERSIGVLISKEISLKELKVKADEIQQFEVIKKAFVRCTNSRNWDTAQSRYSHFADRLHRFSKLSFNKPQFSETFLTFVKQL